ncbi:MAG: ABC transporter substrate-binding protein [Anaerolineales bacterium]|nr:ABC transporter substrate-binding protein [Anaerolineales bacterium]
MKITIRFRIQWIVSVVLLAVLATSGCSSTGAGQQVYRVGILSGLSFLEDISNGFKEGMSELGYVEGENIIYDFQQTEFDMETYRSILQKFIDDDVDMIIVYPTEASIEAKAITAGMEIPVLFVYAVTEETGLVDNIGNPGGNMSGVRYPGIGIALERLEILLELVPDAKNILVPFQRGYPIVEAQMEALYPVAADLGVTLIELPVDSPEELEKEMLALITGDEAGFDAVLIIPEPLMVNPAAVTVLGEISYEYNIPAGGAMASVGQYQTLYGVDVAPFDAGYQAAAMADKVFKGIDVGTLPVETSDTVLAISLPAAEAQGVDVSDAVLRKADTIIR